MNGPDTADETSFYLDYELQVDATRDAVAKLAREVLQYEWADYLRASPPAGGHEWHALDSGKPWGRVTPTSWERGRDSGYDLHFEHYPTPRALQRGQFRLELHLEDGVHGDADFSGDSPYAALRERLVAALDEARGEHDDLPAGEFGTGRTLWRVDSHFLAGDTVAYYEALREALSAHDPFVDAVAAVLDDELPERDPFERG
ncbi:MULTISPECIES: acetyltransferase [Haloferax]|uniref:Uncharacterized protein n=1 Tax=Haloferax massiliensis TaxID=1476858 RepID=A0A0D6JLK7_9EURY|nr:MULTISPECIES: acetyltransferase [Haloferax]MDS0242896.1 acetyltransferase [Haloferax sp. S2CR25]MDS0446017.1 acetyltransferase [Haloferax sp. S2CR25-2]CQR48781.1 hypothetical protein BN996_00229 [Haloferax massiliensis]